MLAESLTFSRNLKQPRKEDRNSNSPTNLMLPRIVMLGNTLYFLTLCAQYKSSFGGYYSLSMSCNYY